MRKLTALVFAVALVFAMVSTADAQRTYTWTTVRSPGAFNLWPNEANSPNIFEADLGLLGRVVTSAAGASPVTDPGVTNACELAPSFNCDTTRPVFLGIAAEGDDVLLGGGPGDGAGSECNRVVIACNDGTAVPSPEHIGVDGGHEAGDEGSYSYLVIHTKSTSTLPEGKGIGFFSGSYTVAQSLYGCNDCPAGGFGKDTNDGTIANGGGVALNNTGASSVAESLTVTLWLTQATAPFGHALVSLTPDGAGAGQTSSCGSGIVFQNLHTDLCLGGEEPGIGDFTIPDQKVVVRTFSITMANHASFAEPEKCNPPACYLEKVIRPTALAQNAATTNIQTQTATTILPTDAPGTLSDATVDSYLVFLTTDSLDIDNDGQIDLLDPCLNNTNPANPCLNKPAPLGGGVCAAGTVVCTDSTGTGGCFPPQFCWSRRDPNQSCKIDVGDINDVFASQLFNVPLPVGPFAP